MKSEREYNEHIRVVTEMITEHVFNQSGFHGWYHILDKIAQIVGASASAFGSRANRGHATSTHLFGSTVVDSAGSIFYERFVREDDDASLLYLQALASSAPFKPFLANDVVPSRTYYDGEMFNEFLHPHGLGMS